MNSNHKVGQDPFLDLSTEDLDFDASGTFQLPALPEGGGFANLYQRILKNDLRVETAMRDIAEHRRTFALTTGEVIRIVRQAYSTLHRHIWSGWVLIQLLRETVKSAPDGKLGGDPIPQGVTDLVDDTYVACATQVLWTVPDGRIFTSAMEVVAGLISRQAGGHEKSLDIELRRLSLQTIFCHYGETLSWWADADNWRATIEDCARRYTRFFFDPTKPEEFSRVVAGRELTADEAEILRLPDARETLIAAQVVADKLAQLPAVGHEFGKLQFIRLRILTYVEAESQTALKRDIAESAWQNIDAKTSPSISLSALHQALKHGAAISITRSQILPYSLREVFQKFGVTIGEGCFRVALLCLRSSSALAECRMLCLELIEFGLDKVLRWSNPLELCADLIHSLDGGVVNCDDADAIHSGDHAALNARIPLRLERSIRFYAELHAALHSRHPATSSKVMFCTMADIPASERGAAIKLKKFVRFINMSDALADLTIPRDAQIHTMIQSFRLAAELGVPNVARMSQILAKVIANTPSRLPEISDSLSGTLDFVVRERGENIYRGASLIAQGLMLSLDDHRLSEGAAIDSAIRISQLVKGEQTSATVRYSGPFKASELSEPDSDARRIAADPAFTDSGIPDDLLMFAYAEQLDRNPGFTEYQRAVNALTLSDHSWQSGLIAARADERIRERSSQKGTGYVTVSDLRAALREDTALIDIYKGNKSGQDTFWFQIITKSGYRRHAHVTEQSHYDLKSVGDSTRPIHLHFDMPRIGRLRDAIVDCPPPTRMCIREADRLLDALMPPFVGEMIAWLRDMAISRLVWWPHGSWHYAPLNLVRVGSGFVSDDMIVTQTPSLEPLLARPGAPGHVDIDFLLVGSSAGGSGFGYASVEALESQVTLIESSVRGRVAKTSGVSLTDTLNVLKRSRYAHFAAHGGSASFLPWHQCLYLGDEGSPFQLFARDLLSVDLRSVRMVTLSACRTALGRFDQLDNQFGLVSAFLAAGVRSIVGCLWEVREEVATCFFVDLYRRLASNTDGSPDLRLMFFESQQSVRLRFPDLRDWAAFVYVGGW